MRSGRSRRNRRKSPHLPKLAAYTGDKNWHSFIYQFERMARKYEWSTRKKGERLIDCLGRKAIDYVRELRIGTDFRLLKEKLSRRFGAKDAPITVRRGLQFIKQEENETLEEYSQRVHFLVMDGYPGAREKTIEHISVEHFLRGCLDKRAAAVTMDKNPKEIHKAVKCVKDTINNRKAIYGRSSSGQSASTRRVSFANPGLYSGDESDTDNYNVRTVSAKEYQSNRSDKALS